MVTRRRMPVTTELNAMTTLGMSLREIGRRFARWLDVTWPMWSLVSSALVNPSSIVPLGGGRVLCAGEQSFVSDDEGKTWTALDLPKVARATRSHAVGREGAFTTSDGWKTFSRTHEGSLNDVCEHDGVAWVYGGTAIHRFVDGKWKKLSTGSRKRVCAIAYGLGALVTSIGKQVIFRSTDLGDSWTQHRLSVRSNEWLTRIWALEQGFLGVSNAHPSAFLSSTDGATWSQVDHSVPPCWTGVAAGDQLWLAGAGVATVVEHLGSKIEEVQSPGEIRVLAYGPDDMDDERLWAASRTKLWIAR